MIERAGERKEIELPRGECHLDKFFSLVDSENADIYIRFALEKGGWLAKVGDNVIYNGEKVGDEFLLGDGDEFGTEEGAARFRLEPAEPRVGGNPVEVIRLVGVNRVVIGRAVQGNQESGKPGEMRVDLDSEIRTISQTHAILQRTKKRWEIVDASSTKTYLNSREFDKKLLTLGDRFQIGPYVFEFEGVQLRRCERMGGARVQCKELTFHAGGRQILYPINLDIKPGSFVGILGGSGQGKSTLLKTLCGLQAPSGGSVLFNGRPVRVGAVNEATVGYVPQDDIVHQELIVEDAITLSARLRLGQEMPREEIDALVDNIIENLELQAHRKKRIDRLSGGQRKRVSIATEMLSNPSVLFLDEPSSGLDPATEHSLMKLLRNLATNGCTVICTTHVLGRAFLFDRILFVHGGRIVCDGKPDEIIQHFGVHALDEVYVKIAESNQSSEELQKNFFDKKVERIESQFQSFSGALENQKESFKNKKQEVKHKIRFWGAFRVQLLRLWKILSSDSLNLMFLGAQPLVIGLLVGWVAEDYVLRLFMCVVATLWFGCSNGAQQIVRELPIFRRERVCGLGIHSYLQSKLVFFSALTIFQAVAVLFFAQLAAGIFWPEKTSLEKFVQRLEEAALPKTEGKDLIVAEFSAVGEEEGSPAKEETKSKLNIQNLLAKLEIRLAAGIATFLGCRDNLLDSADHGLSTLREAFFFSVGGKFIALGLTAIIAVAIGLTISAYVRNGTQAVMWVPLVLIPQILFGGVVLSRPELSPLARFVAYLSPSYSCQRILDVSNVYGRAVPMMSNRTKIPVFLTHGEKETVEWEIAGRSFRETYDRISPINTSWQNLIAVPAVLGQHRNEFQNLRTETGSLRKVYLDAVEVRTDVLYRKGVIYRSLAPFFRSLVSIGIWFVGLYGAMFFSLSYFRTKGGE